MWNLRKDLFEALSSIGSAGSWDCSETCTGLDRAGARQARARTCSYMEAQRGLTTYQAFSRDTYTETSKTRHFDQGYEILFQTPWLLSGDTTPGRLAVNWCPPATTPPPHLRLVSGQTFMVQQLAGNRCRVSAYLTHFIIQSGKLYHHINTHCQKYKSMCVVQINFPKS